MSSFMKSLLGVAKEATTAIKNSTEDMHINLARQNHEYFNDRYFGGNLINALEVLVNKSKDYCFIDTIHFDHYYRNFLRGDPNIGYEELHGKQSIFFDITNPDSTWHINIIRFDKQKDYDTVMLFDSSYFSTINAKRNALAIENSFKSLPTINHAQSQAYGNESSSYQPVNISSNYNIENSKILKIIDEVSEFYLCNACLEVKRLVNAIVPKLDQGYTKEIIKNQFIDNAMKSAMKTSKKPEYQIKAKFQVFIGSYLIDDICSAYLVNKHIDHSLYNTKFIPTVNWASNHLKESETI